MPLQITSRHIEISAGDRAHIEVKADRFRKLVDQIAVLDVILTHQKGLHTAELVLKAHQFDATGQETSADLRTAIDRVVAKVERQLQKQITKRRKQKRHPHNARILRALTLSLPLVSEADEEMPGEDRRIIRSRRIVTKPMSVEEAAEQLEIAAGSFLVFTNAETEQINIIHRLDAGHYGLIEPS